MRSVLSKFTWSDALTFLLFLAFATLLWFGHAYESVRNTHVPVLIHYTGVPGHTAFSTPLPDTVWVEVRDAGKRLRDYHNNSLHLNINLSAQLQREQGTVEVTNDVLRRSVSDLLQGTSKLLSVTPEHLSGHYYTEHAATLPIQLQGEALPEPEYMLCCPAELHPQTVVVYGPKARLDSLRSVPTQSADHVVVRDTTVVRLALEAPAGTRLERDSVDVTFRAERCTEKVLCARLQPRRVPEGVRLMMFPAEVEVTVLVSLAHFGDITDSDVQAYCFYPAAATDKLDVQLHSANRHILQMRAEPEQVEFIIEKKTEQ